MKRGARESDEDCMARIRQEFAGVLELLNEDAPTTDDINEEPPAMSAEYLGNAPMTAREYYLKIVGQNCMDDLEDPEQSFKEMTERALQVVIPFGIRPSVGKGGSLAFAPLVWVHSEFKYESSY